MTTSAMRLRLVRCAFVSCKPKMYFLKKNPCCPDRLRGARHARRIVDAAVDTVPVVLRPQAALSEMPYLARRTGGPSGGRPVAAISCMQYTRYSNLHCRSRVHMCMCVCLRACAPRRVRARQNPTKISLRPSLNVHMPAAATCRSHMPVTGSPSHECHIFARVLGTQCGSAPAWNRQ